MTALNLLSTDKNSAYFSPGFAPTGFRAAVAASFENIRQNFLDDSKSRLVSDPINARNSQIKERFGRSVFELTGVDKKQQPNFEQWDPFEEAIVMSAAANYAKDNLKEANDLIDIQITAGRKENPTQWEGIKTTAELREEGKKVAQEATKVAGEVSARNPSPTSRIAGQLVGGIGGALTDPLNILTMPLGAGAVKPIGFGAFAFAKGLAVTAVKEGAIQAAIQAASVPQVASWQKEVGQKYGLAEAAQDIGLGFAGGAGMRIGFEGIVPAVRGVYRGSNHVSAYILDKIAKSGPDLPQTAKDGLEYMSRTAYVDDSSPVPIKDVGDLKAHREAVQKVAADVDQYRRPAAELPGVSKVITPRNELEFEVKTRVVDIADLVSSDSKAFDQSLQPRDRANRAASDIRINQIAANLDPAQLGDSRLSNTGSPIVGPDMMVESGNGRVMALRKVYEAHPESAQRYRDFIEAQGFDTKDMAQPVLIRQRVSEMTPEQRRQFVVYSNEDTTDRLSTTERAMADARLITPETLKSYRGGDFDNVNNAQFVRDFINTTVAPSERNAYVTPSGRLSQDGTKRIRAAMLAKAYNDADLVQKLLEDATSDIKTIGRVLMDLSGDWARLREDVASGVTRPEFDITSDLMDAVKTVINARDSNRPISDFVNQKGLFSEVDMTAETNLILRGMYNESLSRPLGYDKTKEFLASYVRSAENQQVGPDLLGGKPIEPIDVLAVALKKANGSDAQMVLEDLKANGVEPGSKKVQEESLAALSSSDVKNLPLKNTSEGVDPGFQSLPSQTSDKVLSPFLRKRATTPPSKTTGRLSKDISKPSLSLNKIYHDSNNLSTILQQTQELKPALEGYLQYVSKNVPDSRVEGVRLKEDSSLNAKIARGKEPQQISDFIGGRIIVDTQEALDSILSNIRGTADILEVDDFLSDTRASGYRAVHIQIKSDKGVSAEVQIQPKPIRDVMDEVHAIYKKNQNIAEWGAEQEAEALRAKQLFQDAWSKWELQTKQGAGEGWFDDNAYRAVEYRDQPVVPPSEINPTDRLASSKASFDALAKEQPDAMLTLDDGSTIKISDYATRMKEDQNLLDAITLCRLS